MVQVCQGGECIHSDHGLDLPGKTDNNSRSGGQNTMYSQYKKTKSCILLNIKATFTFTRSENANSTCDRFLTFAKLTYNLAFMIFNFR